MDVFFVRVSFDVVDFDVVMDDLDLNRSRRDDKGNDNPYHNVDEPEEINTVFADPMIKHLMKFSSNMKPKCIIPFLWFDDQFDMKRCEMLENGDVISTKVYDVMVAQEMLKDQAGDVISVEVVSKDMVAEETVVGSSGKDKDVVIPHEVYAAMVVIEGFLYSQDRDVANPTERLLVLEDREEGLSLYDRSLSSPPHTNVADEVASTGVDVRHRGATTTVTSLDVGQGSGNINKTPSMPYNLPFLRGHTLGSDEGRMQQHELMDLFTKLSNRCEALETDLRQTKNVYGDAFTRLIKKIKKLEQTDSSKQGRMIEEIDQDAGVTLVTPTHSQEDQPEDQLGVFSAAKVLADAAKNVYTYTRRRREISTSNGGVSTASRLFNTTEESVHTSGASMPVSTVGMVQEVNKAKTRKAGYEAVVRLQEQLDEEERQRIARVHEKASSFNIEEWEDI
ncbi:hypothetical protein Tco_1165000 [Tanacetum coccineum]